LCNRTHSERLVIAPVTFVADAISTGPSLRIVESLALDAIMTYAPDVIAVRVSDFDNRP
jgi:hypothetical protein